MKLRMAVVLALCVGFVCGIASTQGYAQAAKVTVYNPVGKPPEIQMKKMAERLDTLDGKTIYLVNTGFPNSGPFMEIMAEWFKQHHPKVNTEVRSMGMSSMPAALRAEIKEKADAVFFGLGH